jgi:inner membrane protein COX18
MIFMVVQRYTIQRRTLSLISALSDTLISLHSTGISWGSLIVGSTLVLRTTVTLPIAFIQQNRTKRFLQVQNVLEAWKNTILVHVKSKQELREKNALIRQKAKQLHAQQKCAPVTTFLLPWTQIPLFLTMSLAIRQLVALPLPWMETRFSEPFNGLEKEGFLWFMDLTSSDPFLILPITTGILHLLNIHVMFMNSFFSFLLNMFL